MKYVCKAAGDIKLEYECKIITVAYTENRHITEKIVTVVHPP